MTESIEVYINQELINSNSDFRINQVKRWIIVGRRLGYPKCCIEHVILRQLKLVIRYWDLYTGTGFIPCNKHRSWSYDDIRKEMYANGRPPELPFPSECRSSLRAVTTLKPSPEELLFRSKFYETIKPIILNHKET